MLATAEYGAQTRWLTRQYADAGIDVFVADLIAAARPGQAPITVTTWTDGITTLLPAAEYVSFTRDGVTDARVPWDIVRQRLDLRPEPLITPARYRVGNWLPAPVMDELRAHAAH